MSEDVLTQSIQNVTVEKNQVIFKLWHCTNITKNSGTIFINVFYVMYILPFNSIQHMFIW